MIILRHGALAVFNKRLHGIMYGSKDNVLFSPDGKFLPMSDANSLAASYVRGDDQIPQSKFVYYNLDTDVGGYDESSILGLAIRSETPVKVLVTIQDPIRRVVTIAQRVSRDGSVVANVSDILTNSFRDHYSRVGLLPEIPNDVFSHSFLYSGLEELVELHKSGSIELIHVTPDTLINSPEDIGSALGISTGDIPYNNIFFHNRIPRDAVSPMVEGALIDFFSSRSEQIRQRMDEVHNMVEANNIRGV